MTEILVVESDEPSPSLKRAQEYVGGTVQRVRLKDRTMLLMDEDGKEKDYPVNEEATAMLRESNPSSDFIVGNVIHLKGHATRKWL